MKRTILVSALLLLCFPSFTLLAAQTVEVDTTHATNHFVPKETLGAGVDRISVQAIDKDLLQPTLGQTQASGWQPVTYRQNTELAIEAWHWNPQGTWSDPSGKGYFVGSATPSEMIRYSYGYGLPRRGFTRNDGTDAAGFSRLTDGDLTSFWKSNPYLSERFTGESDALHPQWVVLDLTEVQEVNTIRIAWGEPYARRYVVQYFTGEDPFHAPTRGLWQTFAMGTVTGGKGGTETVRFSRGAMSVRFVRIWMTESSNTCDADGPTDPRNCVGYAIREIYLGMTSADGAFHDVIRHTPDQDQTATYCSSVDSWHQPSDLGSTTQAQVGFDLFFTSGVTRGLPAMIPVAVIYETPENAAAEIAYLENRKYPISYVEVGEEADGQFMLPEDYAALYLQWATALHKVDPALKLGGPSFTGENRDIEAWPDANGNVSWTGRFVNYLKQHGRLNDLAFFSFEHYPYDPCRNPWGALYEEPELVSHIMQVWRDDGVPADVPMFITEGNLSSAASESYQDIFAGIWLADYVGAFLNAGGKGVYFFHYLPLPMEPGCNGSPGTFGMFTINNNYEIQQPLAQFFVAQLINLEWVQPDGGVHQVYAAKSDVEDGAGHELVTAYAVKRPDGQWSLLVINKDPSNAHEVTIAFENGGKTVAEGFAGPVKTVTFGAAEYVWHSSGPTSHADPDGPAKRSIVESKAGQKVMLPKASVTVLTGTVLGL